MKRAFEVFNQAIELLDSNGIQYVVGGGIGVWAYGRKRFTKDLDIFLSKNDAERSLELLARSGYRTEKADERWIYKAYKQDTIIDIIFHLLGGLEIDENMLARARVKVLERVTFKIMSPEDIIVLKVSLLKELRPDWHDATSIIEGLDGRLDWDYFIERSSFNPMLSLSFVLYAQCLLGNDQVIPQKVIEELVKRGGLG